METMQVVTFLIVSSISTIVSSSKLCCEKTQYFDSRSQRCLDIPDEFKASWLALLNDNETMSEAMEFVEFNECEIYIIRQTYISSCYSPYYDMMSNQFYFYEFSNVPCDGIMQPIAVRLGIVVAICNSSVGICLPIMVVYTCRKKKELKEKLTLKLVSWYLVTMAGDFVAIFCYTLYAILSKNISEDAVDIYDSIRILFFVATYLWQNVIGFQIWSGFKAQNLQNNSDKDRRRCVYYSIYVWGLTAVITSLYVLLSNSLWFEVIGGSIMLAILCFNLLTYFILSVNICMTRCRVINLTDEVNFKRKLTILILRLGLVMGFPRMLVAILTLVCDFNRIIYAIWFVLEPCMVFTVLVWKPTGGFTWIFGCSSYRKEPPKTSNAAEVVYTNREISLTNQ